ncbi:hypothetical protein CAPN002_00050 [Capnocytophaga stomatis]|uniref:toprim domain-containing protein n=1 Tax=Capnocytophaga stomatis TaxID=1848904 RepID=UPI00194FF458|nr:toprim domain-containing protein [Capnocytophaga stomatis]GIJ92787.1 hypothetical protein CAPN002_00050 [Capnocytophaga stomatis]
MENKRLNQNDIEKISDSVSLIDYFFYLERKGVVKFDRKTGHDHYFFTDNNKFSVTDKGFFDFKTGKGGQIIKAVMELENKSWKEAIDFLKDFSQIEFSNEIKEKREKIKKQSSNTSKTKITKVTTPNNEKLIAYFKERGISEEVLKNNTNQIHYQTNEKEYFGIGLKNQSEGYEIRNPFLKSKVGKSDISIINENKNQMVVFEGMTDMLSFLQLLKDNNRKNNYTLVVLNSVTNTDNFIERFKNYEGKINLILDGDQAGDEATNKIKEALSHIMIEDVRKKYGISENGIIDLNDYLKNKLRNIENQEKNRTLAVDFENKNNSQNEQPIIESTRVSHSKSMGINSFEQNTREYSKTSQSEQNSNNTGGQNLDGNNAGNGLSSSEQLHKRDRQGGKISTSDRTQQKSNQTREILQEKEQERSGEHIYNRDQSRNKGNGENQVIDSFRPAILEKLHNLKGEKLDNEQITEIVNEIAFVSEKKQIQLQNNIFVSDEIKELISQYKSGGIAKEGRGVLDEYYTDEKLVMAIRNLIKDKFDGKSEINILEPSVGIGNFLLVPKELGIKTNTTAFEINETTAKIAKILNPETEINLRSFETEFITDKGQKKDIEQKYDLVIGNPPYGQHRGFYKGLGEEPSLARYEDYFVKRSLDVMKEGAILAMVLPSGWLNRQNNLTDAELSEAFRLPNGVFKATNVGTDIIVLKKNSQAPAQDISSYFVKHPENILGEKTLKTNRFGKLEDYIKGNLDEALLLLDSLRQENYLKKQRSSQQEKATQLDLFDNVAPTSEIQDTEKKKEDNSKSIATALQKVSETLQILNNIKFKSLTIIEEIEKYSLLEYNLKEYSKDFSKEELDDILKKADNIVQSQNKKNTKSEYLVQTTPEIKKGILKYQYQKQDNIVDTGLQNSPNLSEEEIEAFKNTRYNGVLDSEEKKFDKYKNLYKGKQIHDFYYAEGDIYEKLEKLEIEFSGEKTPQEQKQYEKQKALLESVLPPKKSLDDITISPNHEFVHNFNLGQTEKEKVWHNPITKQWVRETVLENESLAERFINFVRNLPPKALGQSSSWEVASFVNNENVTGSDRDRNMLIKERRKEVANNLFNKFLREELSDNLKVRFVDEFNRKYNNIHIPDYSQFPLFSRIHQNFKGKPLRLTEVQKAGIGRLTTKGVGLLAHEVGFGKTLSGVLSIHEAMERGNIKRPLIVVPNDSILKQWAETIFETIPQAKVNVLGNLGKGYDLSKFDNKDGEISLVTYEGFNNIGFSNSVSSDLADKFSYISEKDLTGLDKAETEREIELEKAQQEEVYGKIRKGKVYDWEDFGFDHLTFDEVHNANHIVSKVRIEDRRFASDFRNQQQRTSKLGLNTWVASQYIQEQNDGRNVTLLSATPFTNKPLEYYSILSLIANERLEKSGYFNVNNFFETFMEADNDMEIDAKGDVKYKMNVRRFKNNNLFQQLLGEFIDIKGEEDNPELKRPNRINKEYKIEQNTLTKEMYESLNNKFDESKEGAILTHILNARKIAFSPYLSNDYVGKNPTNKEFIENSPKLKTTMDLIAQNKKDKPEAGQIIYSELGVSEFPKLKDYLVEEVGYKSSEVALITGATTKNNRLDIQQKFNEGKIKIVIGSEAIQEGMNLQENTTDMYLLTLPYNFTSLRQTEGRAWRQGNKWENVRINFMLTNDSVDVFMLQKLQAKQARYIEAIKKGANIIDISDVDTQELKTAIITNPETRAEIEIKLLENKYKGDKIKYEADLGFVSRKFKDYIKSDEYHEVQGFKEKIERYKVFSDNGQNEYWTKEMNDAKQKLIIAEKKLEQLSEELSKKGLHMVDFQEQVNKTKAKIEELDNKIKEELPLIKEKLIAQYKTEKEEKLKKTSNTNFVAERAQENKNFFKMNSPEKREITQEQQEYQKSRIKR